MKISRSAKLPLEMLWDYREFKRDETPSPLIPFIHDHTTDEITEYVSVHGIDPVELSIIQGQALLTDGNHRIVAAKRLGHTTIPVRVTLFLSDGTETFYDHTLSKFKKLSEALESEITKLFGQTAVHCASVSSVESAED